MKTHKNQQMKISSRHVSVVLTLYLLACAGWWTKLLYDKNESEYAIRLALLRHELVSEGKATLHTAARAPAYQKLLAKYHRQRDMIIGEGVVFFIILMLGLVLLSRSWRYELALARQQSNFLLSITHELKSPLASIRLVLDTVLRHQLAKPQLDLLAHTAIVEVNRLHELVNNLLMAARLDTDFALTKTRFDVNEALHALVQQQRDKHPRTPIILTVDNAAPDFEADHLAFSTIVVNLLENAVKYSPVQSPINVSLRRQSQHLLLEVGDLGKGIPDSEKPHVFKKFYRIGNENTRRTKGTGLGLFIVKSLVQAHNGTVVIKDNTPQGCLFQVRLPSDTYLGIK